MATATSALFQSALEKYTLSRNVSAIQVTSSMDGRAQLGTIMQLPEGAQVEICGDGFNDQTVKVRCEGSFYFIFLEDIQASSQPHHRRARAYA